MVLDSDPSEKIMIVKADTKEEELFSPHPQAKDKMKNCYSAKNIRRLTTLINSKKEFKYKSKFIDSKDRYEINISNEIGFNDDSKDVSFDELTNELNMLMKHDIS